MRRRAHSAVRLILTISIAIAVIAIAIAVFFHFLRPVVVVTEAVSGPVVQAFYSTGTIQPEREFPIKSNTAGILTEVKVDKGDRVTKGQALAIVSDPSLVYTKDKAQAELSEKLARADEKTSPVLMEFDSRITAATQMFDIAKREEKRLQEASTINAASPSSLDQSSSKVSEMWSMLEGLRSQKSAKKLELDREVDVARAALRTAEWYVEQQTLKSPIDGVVLDRPISVGTRLAINDVMMRVADITPENLVMRAAVDEEDIAKVRVAQALRMTLYSFPGQVFVGHAKRIYDQADAARRTFEVDVLFENTHERFSPGMTGELAWIIDSRDASIVVPSQAYQNGAVYVVSNNKLTRRTVEAGLKSVERVEIKSGLQAGERVVISTIGSMSDGQRVRTQYTDPLTAAGVNKAAVKDDSFKGFNR